MRIVHLLLQMLLILMLVVGCDSQEEDPQIDVESLDSNASILNFTGISSVDQVNSTSAKLVWNQVIWALGYYIIHEKADGSKVIIGKTDGNARSYIVNGLMPQTDYKFNVQAVDFYGKQDGNTNTADVRTLPTPRTLTWLYGTQGGFYAWAEQTREVKRWGHGKLALTGDNNIGDEPEEMGDINPTIGFSSVTDKTNRLFTGPRAICSATSQAGLPYACAGYNKEGQLGIGSSVEWVDSIAQLHANPTIDAGVAQGQIILAIHLGLSFTCAQIIDGTVKCWGKNDKGQLGIGSTTPRGTDPGHMGNALTPALLPTGTKAVKMAAGDHHICALLDDQTVRCWGDNQYGQLGIGSTTNIGVSEAQMGDALVPVNFGEGIYATSLFANGDSTCAIVSTGRPACWGRNLYSKLGVGGTENIGDDPEEVAGGLEQVILNPSHMTVSYLAGMKDGFCALRADRQITCWGRNHKGQLGLEHLEDVTSNPQDIVKLPPNHSFISIANNSFGHNMCGVLHTQQVACWGENLYGELGQGDTLPRGGYPGEMVPTVDLGDFLPSTAQETGDFAGGDINNVEEEFVPPENIEQLCQTDLTKLTEVFEDYIAGRSEITVRSQDRYVDGRKYAISNSQFDMYDKSIDSFAFKTIIPKPFGVGDRIELRFFRSTGCINYAPLDYQLIFNISANQVQSQEAGLTSYVTGGTFLILIEGKGVVALNSAVEPYLCQMTSRELENNIQLEVGCNLQVDTTMTRMMASVEGQVFENGLVIEDTFTKEKMTINETGQYQLQSKLFIGQAYNLAIESHPDLLCESPNSTGVLAKEAGSNTIQISCQKKSCLNVEYAEFPSEACSINWLSQDYASEALGCALAKKYIHDQAKCQTQLTAACMDPNASNSVSTGHFHDDTLCNYDGSSNINIDNGLENIMLGLGGQAQDKTAQIVYLIDPKASMDLHREKLVKMGEIVLDQLKDHDVKFFAYSTADGRFQQNSTQSFESRVLVRHPDESYSWHYSLAPSIIGSDMGLSRQDSQETRAQKLEQIKMKIMGFAAANRVNVRTKPLCALAHIMEKLPHANPQAIYRPNPLEKTIVLSNSDDIDHNSRRSCLKTMHKVNSVKYGYRLNYVRLHIQYTWADSRGNLKNSWKFIYKKNDLAQFDHSSFTRTATDCPQDLKDFANQKKLFRDDILAQGSCKVSTNNYSRFLSDHFLTGENVGLDICSNPFAYGNKNYTSLKDYMTQKYQDFVFTDTCFKSELGTTRTEYEYLAQKRSQAAFITDIGARMEALPHFLYISNHIKHAPIDSDERALASVAEALPPHGTQMLLIQSAGQNQVIVVNGQHDDENAYSSYFQSLSEKLRIQNNKVRFELAPNQELKAIYLVNGNESINLPLSEVQVEMVSGLVGEISFTSTLSSYRHIVLGFGPSLPESQR